MTFLVTGAAGNLGALAVEALLDRGVAPGDIVATARDTDRLSAFAARGVVTRRLDYDDPASVEAALEGVDRLLLVSSSAVGQRVAQHRTVLEAAARRGVELVAYTSILRADPPRWPSPPSTSRPSRSSPSSVSRTCCSATAGTSRTTPRRSPSTSSTAWSVRPARAGSAPLPAPTTRRRPPSPFSPTTAPGRSTSWAATWPSRWPTTPPRSRSTPASEVAYVDLPQAEYAAALVSAGLPAGYAELLADSDRGIAAGDLYQDSGTLSTLIGRPDNAADRRRQGRAGLSKVSPRGPLQGRWRRSGSRCPRRRTPWGRGHRT